MTRFLEHYKAPAVYFAGPDDAWRAAVAGVEHVNGRYIAPHKAKFKYAGPIQAYTHEDDFDYMFVTERVWKARDADIVFGYFKDPMDYMTIGELAFASAMGNYVQLVVGPDVPDQALAALAFICLDDAVRVANDAEAKVFFEDILKNFVKTEKCRFFTIEEDDPDAEESAEQRPTT